VTPLPSLSLYVHFPWCVRKCPYCDFNSFTLHGELAEAPYVAALLQDLSQQASSLQGRPIQSVFLGGGTPSLFSAAAMARLLEGVAAQCQLAPHAEITLEANPGTVERGRFDEYRAAGITRVSLGAQSFDDQQLQRLGRIHQSADTYRAAEELHAAGLANFNLDLMYGLPLQSIDDALADLTAAIGLQPAHLSHYQLTLEPGTVFAGRPPAGLPDDDQAADMQSACQGLIANAGFRQYEVSAYALEGSRSRHNLNYWQFGDYLGVGAGAHGKSSDRQRGRLIIGRSLRPREPRRYLAEVTAGNGPAWQGVSEEELPFEFLLNALRLIDGFEPGVFEARTGLSFDVISSRLEQAQLRGLMQCIGGWWRTTPQGMNFLNDLLGRFLPGLSDKRKAFAGFG
jgi:putative oxygen-independent coproporphyrinogen III oxidase